MRVSFYLIGKIKEDYILEGISKYKTLLRPFCDVEICFFDDVTYKKEPSEKEIINGLDKEAESVLSKIDQQDLLILCDLHGRSLDSIELANYINSEKNNKSRIKIVIGSSYGLSDKLRRRADLCLKLSDLTFVHPMCLLLMMEQIYRVFKINSNQTYHK